MRDLYGMPEVGAMSGIWITTKGGDGGETNLGNGVRIPKDHPRVNAYGTLDECQAHIGMARSLCEYPEIAAELCMVEQELGALMGYIALYPGLTCPDITKIERITEIVAEVTGKTFRFVRPGDSTTGAALHVARTVARRAERWAVSLFRSGELPEDAMRYINRLSDVLYAMALWHDTLRRRDENTPERCP